VLVWRGREKGKFFGVGWCRETPMVLDELVPWEGRKFRYSRSLSLLGTLLGGLLGLGRLLGLLGLGGTFSDTSLSTDLHHFAF
jgi:hypothetical protein